MDGPLRHYAKLNKPITKEQRLRLHLYEVPRVVKFTETERMMAGKPWRGRTGSLNWER